MNIKILASNIQHLRLEKNWTQNDLADFLNVSRQAVSKWETAQSIPDLDLLLKLSKLFSKSINELIEIGILAPVKSLEDISLVDKITLENVLNTFEREDLIKAAKGLSPMALSYLCTINGYEDLDMASKTMAPVKLSEVEDLHQQIIDALNEHMVFS